MGMRSNEQFKALVYAKAEQVRVENKKKRAGIMRGIATFSLIAVIGGAFLFSNYKNDAKKHIYDGAENHSIAGKGYRICDVESSEVGVMPTLADDAIIVESEICNESFAEHSEEDFSYKQDVVYYSSNNFEEQVQTDRGNVAIDITSKDEIIEIAKSLCTVEYNTYKVYFDSDTGVWKINFYTEGVAGGDQSVYLDSNGSIKMIIYGE